MLKNLVYFGSPDFSAQILESIIASKQVHVVGVVTTPDKPQGRKQILTPSLLSLVAQKYDLPTYKPVKLDESNLSHLKLLKPDIFMVVSYGKIIPKSWIDTPSIGTFNVHFSLLPKYRGALCIQQALKNQNLDTGVTLMVMDEQLDHGPIISQTTVPIAIEDNVTTLTTKLTQTSKEILRQKLPEICAQNYISSPQDEAQATFTPSHRTLSHQSAFIPWSDISPYLDVTSSLRGTELRGNLPVRQTGLTLRELHALIRSLTPEPGAWTVIPSPVGAHHDAPEAAIPTTIEMKILKTSLIYTKLIIDTVQIPGKNPISWKQFLSGHPLLV